MNRDLVYFHDILERIDRIRDYLTDGRAAFFRSTMIQDAVLQNLVVIAEAAKRMSDAAREAAPEIPWQQITGMRNRIIHDYGVVDLVEVWRVAEDDLEFLYSAVIRLQSEASRQTDETE